MGVALRGRGSKGTVSAIVTVAAGAALVCAFVGGCVRDDQSPRAVAAVTFVDDADPANDQDSNAKHSPLDVRGVVVSRPGIETTFHVQFANRFGSLIPDDHVDLEIDADADVRTGGEDLGHRGIDYIALWSWQDDAWAPWTPPGGRQPRTSPNRFAVTFSSKSATRTGGSGSSSTLTAMLPRTTGWGRTSRSESRDARG